MSDNIDPQIEAAHDVIKKQLEQASGPHFEKKEQQQNSSNFTKKSVLTKIVPQQKAALAKIPRGNRVVIIGAGIGGLATAALLGKKGYQVTVLEKNAQIGGRASLIIEKGYVFDKGPSWYMMPDVFEHFFELLGENIKDYFSLKKLSPSYRIFNEADGKIYDFFSDLEKNISIFETIEQGAGEKLRTYIETTKKQYDIATREFMYKNYDSIFDFFNKRVFTEGRNLPLFSKVSKIVNASFKADILRKVMQYQTVLLGTSPNDAPGIYTLMNYVDFVGGVWYPDKGICMIPEALKKISEKHSVQYFLNSPVKRIIAQGGVVQGVELQSGRTIEADIVISNADMHHTETSLLPKELQTYGEGYWQKKILAPSAFILYLGLKEKVPSLSHHNLFFAKDWNKNFKQIFNSKQFPDNPSIYLCCPSKTDSSVAPEGKENIFVLVPIAPGIEYGDIDMDLYTEKILRTLETEFKIENIKEKIEYQKTYCVKDFVQDYNSFKGTALGLAHTLMQTGIFRPNNISKKVKNLFYVGAGTNPGIGMPICLISAELVYKRIEGILTVEPLENL